MLFFTSLWKFHYSIFWCAITIQFFVVSLYVFFFKTAQNEIKLYRQICNTLRNTVLSFIFLVMLTKHQLYYGIKEYQHNINISLLIKGASKRYGICFFFILLKENSKWVYIKKTPRYLNNFLNFSSVHRTQLLKTDKCTIRI